MTFDTKVLDINPAAETDRIVSMLRHNVTKVMRRRGAVVGVSGGVDSAVVLALCARAFNPQRLTALVMPEVDSDPESEELACQVAHAYGVQPVVENITPVLHSFGSADLKVSDYGDSNAPHGRRTEVTYVSPRLRRGRV